MIFILLFTVVSLGTIISIIRSGKSLRHILTEIKYELIVPYYGWKAIIEDKLLRNKNVTGIFLNF